MRREIIQSSIIGLQKDGLRFSIDEVAKRLKISKKTIYKYFATKEDLAVEIYKTYYEEAMQLFVRVDDLQTKERAERIIGVYYKSHCMIRNEIFNKYALNESIRTLALTNHNKLKAQVENLLPETDRTARMLIIDGALKNLCGNQAEEGKVIEKLAELLCL